MRRLYLCAMIHVKIELASRHTQGSGIVPDYTAMTFAAENGSWYIHQSIDKYRVRSKQQKG